MLRCTRRGPLFRRMSYTVYLFALELDCCTSWHLSNAALQSAFMMLPKSTGINNIRTTYGCFMPFYRSRLILPLTQLFNDNESVVKYSVLGFTSTDPKVTIKQREYLVVALRNHHANSLAYYTQHTHIYSIHNISQKWTFLLAYASLLPNNQLCP